MLGARDSAQPHARRRPRPRRVAAASRAPRSNAPTRPSRTPATRAKSHLRAAGQGTLFITPLDAPEDRVHGGPRPAETRRDRRGVHPRAVRALRVHRGRPRGRPRDAPDGRVRRPPRAPLPEPPRARRAAGPPQSSSIRARSCDAERWRRRSRPRSTRAPTTRTSPRTSSRATSRSACTRCGRRTGTSSRPIPPRASPSRSPCPRPTSPERCTWDTRCSSRFRTSWRATRACATVPRCGSRAPTTPASRRSWWWRGRSKRMGSLARASVERSSSEGPGSGRRSTAGASVTRSGVWARRATGPASVSPWTRA